MTDISQRLTKHKIEASMSHDQMLVVAIFVINMAIMIWFIYSINCISSSLVEIAEYTRRTALSLPLTTDQVKLINRKFTGAELAALLGRQGAIVQLGKERHLDGGEYETLAISNTGAADSELVKLAWANGDEILKHLKSTTSQAASNDNLPKK